MYSDIPYQYRKYENGKTDCRNITMGNLCISNMNLGWKNIIENKV
jgi:hypothetical protein